MKKTPKENLRKLQQFCFGKDIKVPWNKIFAIGIYSQLRLVVPSHILSANDLYKAIGFHVKSPAYLKRLMAGGYRYGVNYVREGKATKEELRLAKDQYFKFHVNKGLVPQKTPYVSDRKPKLVTKNTLRLKVPSNEKI